MAASRYKGPVRPRVPFFPVAPVFPRRPGHPGGPVLPCLPRGPLAPLSPCGPRRPAVRFGMRWILLERRRETHEADSRRAARSGQANRHRPSSRRAPSRAPAHRVHCEGFFARRPISSTPKLKPNSISDEGSGTVTGSGVPGVTDSLPVKGLPFFFPGFPQGMPFWW